MKMPLLLHRRYLTCQSQTSNSNSKKQLTSNLKPWTVTRHRRKLPLPQPLRRLPPLPEPTPLPHRRDVASLLAAERPVRRDVARAEKEDIARVEMRVLRGGDALHVLKRDCVGCEVRDRYALVGSVGCEVDEDAAGCDAARGPGLEAVRGGGGGGVDGLLGYAGSRYQRHICQPNSCNCTIPV